MPYDDSKASVSLQPESTGLSQVLVDAEAFGRDRRTQQRTPYFKPAKALVEGNQRQPIFILDISPKGLKFIHTQPMEPQELKLELELASGELAEFDIRIIWTCREADWWITGGEICSRP